jgi:fibro-slime domain-containing protein
MAVALATCLTAACGSRTALEAACGEAGMTAFCSTSCGAGEQVCADGRWQPCEVPVATRNCDNDCGRGIQTCAADSWGTCEVPLVVRSCSTLCGTGHETCADGTWQPCDAPRPTAPKLRGTVRDFRDTHPDFERMMGTYVDLGMVAPMLGADDKPVYAGRPTTPTTSGQSFFDEWYRDTPGVNATAGIVISLTPSPADAHVLAYHNGAFFPIDDALFGNQGRPHNYHFTLELPLRFRYSGGEVFRFTGDDDLWIFINRQLAVDLGGIHAAMSATIDLDAKSQELGIAKGGIYSFNLFFAERHTSASTLHMETTVGDIDACD